MVQPPVAPAQASRPREEVVNSRCPDEQFHCSVCRQTFVIRPVIVLISEGYRKDLKKKLTCPQCRTFTYTLYYS